MIGRTLYIWNCSFKQVLVIARNEGEARAAAKNATNIELGKPDVVASLLRYPNPEVFVLV